MERKLSSYVGLSVSLEKVLTVSSTFPVPGEDGHYKAFPDVFGSDASEEFRRSQVSKKAKTLPFYASVQHVKNSQLMVQCEECNMWRLVFSKYKHTSKASASDW